MTACSEWMSYNSTVSELQARFDHIQAEIRACGKISSLDITLNLTRMQLQAARRAAELRSKRMGHFGAALQSDESDTKAAQRAYDEAVKGNAEQQYREEQQRAERKRHRQQQAKDARERAREQAKQEQRDGPKAKSYERPPEQPKAQPQKRKQTQIHEPSLADYQNWWQRVTAAFADSSAMTVFPAPPASGFCGKPVGQRFIVLTLHTSLRVSKT